MVEKGYGFIRPAAGGSDVFFHLGGLANRVFETLKEGEMCSYDIEYTVRGPRAIRVYVV
jgi:CspA family cold shock protein